MSHYQICSNCVMDTTDPAIFFDDKGVCHHCNDFYSHTRFHWYPDEKGKAILDQKLSEIREAGKGREFDCIIGMSGGADSSYLVYLAKKHWNLRPLVFHVDAGWNSETAVRNIECVIEGLGLELFTEVIDWEEIRDLQLAFFKSGVPHIDLPQDHAFFATMYKFAEKYKVKHILTGANISTECVRNPLAFFYYGTDMWQIRDIHNRFGSRKLQTFPFSGVLRHKVYLRYIRGIEVVRPLNYVPYVKAEAMNTLTRELRWQQYGRKHNESRFTKFYEGYWLPTKFGFDTRRVQFSSFILTGQMKREQALEELKKPSYDPETIEQDILYVATKLGISTDELKSYHDAPNKSFRDYRNQYALFEIGGKIMQWLGLEERAKKR